MPGGMGKGSKPSGNTTQTTINPTQMAQLPFLQSGWGSAQDLYNNNPYSYFPGTTLATPNSYLPQGYNSLAGSAQSGMDMLPGVNSLFSGMTSGVNNIYASPAFSGLSDIASGSNAYLGSSAADAAYLNNLAGQAASNPYSGQLQQLAAEAGVHDYGMNSLQNTASGMYLNSNPYLDSMFGSASDAVTRAYQTATAPTTASSFSGAGRYGSGAMANATSQNQQDLGSSLGNLSANIYGGNYQAERARQDAASQALSALMQQNYGLQGQFLNSAGNQYLAGLGQAAQDTTASGQLSLANLGAQQRALDATQSGYQAGNQQQLAALAMFPSLMQAQYAPSQAMIQAGQGLTGLDQAQIQDQMNRFYGEQEAPWTQLSKYMAAIGQPTTGSSSQTNPYFTNPMANILGAATGGLGLYNGLSGAFGGGSGAAADALMFGDTGLSSGALSAALGETGAAGGGLGSMLPMAMAWIICTELVKQGRLPKRWWAAGAKTFAAYPEIAKRGYYVWAIPSVRYLRRKPNSLYSRLLCKVFNWRAEDIAARRGVRGARKLWRGRAVTAALALPCLVLGAVAKEQDWQVIYREEHTT